MRRMTKHEAIDFLATAFNVAPDSTTDTQIDATVAGIDAVEASEQMDAYLSIVPGNIDPDSIEIRRDVMDDGDIDMTVIIIRIGGGS